MNISIEDSPKVLKKDKQDLCRCNCLRCGKPIPLTWGAMEEVGYTKYSYCEDCLREGLKLLKEHDKEEKSKKHYLIMAVFNDGMANAKPLNISVECDVPITASDKQLEEIAEKTIKDTLFSMCSNVRIDQIHYRRNEDSFETLCFREM